MLLPEGYLGRPSETLFPWSSLPKWEISAKSINESESWKNHFLHPWASLGNSHLNPSCPCGFLIMPGSSKSAPQQPPHAVSRNHGVLLTSRSCNPGQTASLGKDYKNSQYTGAHMGSVEKNQRCLGPTLSLSLSECQVGLIFSDWRLWSRFSQNQDLVFCTVLESQITMGLWIHCP